MLAAKVVARAQVRAAKAVRAVMAPAVLAHRVTDSIKEHRADGHLKSLDRDKLWAMETPQVFKYPLIKDAYAKVIKEGQTITDDLSAIEYLKIQVSLISNGRPNPKITTPDDLALIEYLLTHK